MQVVKKLVFSGLFSVWLAGCSSHYASNADALYLKSRNGPDLVVPSPLTMANMGYFYNLPGQNQDARVSIKPPTM